MSQGSVNRSVALVGCEPAVRPTQRMRLAVFVLVTMMVSMFSVFAVSATAFAHDDDQSYLYLDFGESLVARLQMPFADVSEALGVEIGGSDGEIDAAIADNARVLQDYAAAHFNVGTGGTIFNKSAIETLRFAETNHVEVAFTIFTGPAIPDSLDVELDPFFDEIDDRDALLLVANDWNRGVVDNEGESLLRFVPGNRAQTVVFGESSSWTNFTTSIQSGLNHIRTGPDHMLFVVALLLPSVLVWTTAWRPASRFGSTLWRVTKILTMFTIAHSVTFSLAGLGIVPTPGPRITETIIALSIAVTALHNLRPIFRQREWVIAFVFGLFHGFGFASLTQSLDVSTSTQLISLAGRNIGIEIGQLFVVLLIFPMLYLLRVTNIYLPLFRVACIGLIIASIGWMTERLFDWYPVTSLVIDKVVDYPRVLLLVAAGTIAALYWHFSERSKGRLLDPADGAKESIDPSASPDQAVVIG